MRLQFFCVEGVPGHQAHTSHTTGHGVVSTKHIGGGGSAGKAASVLGTEDFSITAEARILPPPSAATTRPSTPGSHRDSNEDDPEETGEEAQAPVDVTEEALAILICNSINLTEFKQKAGRALYEMRCQLSLNGQDFSSLKVSHALHKPRHGDAQGTETGQADHHQGAKATPATLFYSVTPTAVQPSCVSIDRFTSAALLHSQLEGEQLTQQDSALELHVKGSSFLPASRLPKGAFVEARLVPSTTGIEWKSGYVPVWTDAEAALSSVPPIQCPVRCDGCISLTVEISSQTEVVLGRTIAAVNNLASGLSTDAQEGASVEQHLDTLSLRLEFDLHLPDRVIPLTHEDSTVEPVFLKLYRNKPMQLIPGAVSSMSSEAQEFTMLVSRAITEQDKAEGVSSATEKCADGFLFHSADVVIAVHVPVPQAAEGVEIATVAPAFYPPILLPQSAVRFLPVPAPLPEQPPVAPEEGEVVADGEPASADEAAAVEAAAVDGTPPAAAQNEVSMQKYLLQFQLQSAAQLRELCHPGEQSSESQEPLSHVFVSCWLDGKSQSPPETWAKLQFHHTLTHQCAVNPPAPKIGFVPGNSITLDLVAYIPPPCVVHPSVLQGCAAAETDEPIRAIIPLQCLIRIRGAPTEEYPEGAAVEVAGVIAESAVTPGTSAITFDIPEFAAEGMVPVQKTPKDKTLYYVDISIDGGISFDKAESPLLFLK